VFELVLLVLFERAEPRPLFLLDNLWLIFDSLLEARNVLKRSVLFNGEVFRNISFFFSGDAFLCKFFKGEVSRVFLCGEGEVLLLKSNDLSGDEGLDCADLSRALVTVSSLVNFADLAGECSLIRVGFPGSIVMYVFVVASSDPSELLYLVPEQLLVDLLSFDPFKKSGSIFSLYGDEDLPGPSIKPFSDLVPDLSLRVLPQLGLELL
jgi:hypothetical protein